MSQKLPQKYTSLKKLFLYVFTSNTKYQIVHIHNDGLAKFVLVAKFLMFKKNSERLKKVTYCLITQEEELNLSLEKISYDYKSKKFNILLKPLTIPQLIKEIQEFIPEEEIIMASGSQFVNNIQFLVDGNPRDSISGQTGFGDQACNFKVI